MPGFACENSSANVTLVVRNGGIDAKSIGTRNMDLTNSSVWVVSDVYATKCAVENGIVFFIVENDLFYGVTCDVRDAVVSIDCGAGVGDGSSDWR